MPTPRAAGRPVAGRTVRLRRRRPPLPQLTAMSSLDMFAAVPPQALLAVVPHADLVMTPAGSEIAVAGRLATEFIGIVDGCVDAVDPTGWTVRRGPGADLDSVAVLQRGRRMLTVTACTDTVLLVMHPRALRAAVTLPGAVAPVADTGATAMPSAPATPLTV